MAIADQPATEQFVVDPQHGESVSVEMVSERNIYIDHNYQRPLDETKVRRIADHLDPAALGALCVAKRGHDAYYAWDGQHRLEAVRRAKPGSDVLCLVYRGLSTQREAELFTIYNTNRGTPRAVARFRARLYWGDPVATEIKRIVDECGIELVLDGVLNQKNAKSNQMQGVSALESIFDRSGDRGLKQVLLLAKHAWDGSPYGLEAGMLRGIHRWIMAYRGEYDHSRLVSRLTSLDPRGLRRDASALAHLAGGGLDVNIARAILKAYNHGLSANRLPSKFAEADL